MGSSNLNCAVSNFPIKREERVMCIFLVDRAKRSNSTLDLKPYYPWGRWTFGSLPFEVEMSDYSAPVGISEGSESGEIDTFNPIDKFIYEHFRKKVYVYIPESRDCKEKKLVETGKHRDNWYHIMQYGSYDKCVGFASSYRPKLIQKDPINPSLFDWLHGFDPDIFNVMYIRKDVYEYLTQPSKYKGTADDGMQIYFDNVAKYHKLPDGEHKTELRFQISSPERFEFLDVHLRDYFRKMLLNEFDVKTLPAIQKKFHELDNLTSSLWQIQRQITPSHGLSPQGGCLGDVKAMDDFNKKLVELYKKNCKRY